MPETASITRVLVNHFFRRFFDSDIVQVDGETLTTIVRAVAATAIPGLMFAFFLQNQYPARSLWGAIQDQYFFVLFSFVVMGSATIFEWDMLFPDRWDFLILSPLPLKPLQMLSAKVIALAGFMALFLFSSNAFGTLLLPAVSKGTFYRQVLAHGCAVAMAGLFASLLFLALGGVLLCLLGGARFGAVSPLLQMLSITGLVLLMLHYLQYGDAMQALLARPLGMARWVPPLWFLAIYERILRGDAAPAFAREMAGCGVWATLGAAAIVLITYPVAWARMRRTAIEGASPRRRSSPRWIGWLLTRALPRPAERGVFLFISQTIARNNRYQVYLAIYGGTGLALAAACVIRLTATAYGLRAELSNKGLHAIMPLLLFWVIAGLRTAFAFPLDLAAGWIFRITAASVSECAAAGRRWVLACSLALTGFILLALRLAGWDLRRLLVQLVVGIALCILLADLFFAFDRSVPLNKARMPGRTNLPLILTLYVGVFPPFVHGVIALETQAEKALWKLLTLAAGVTLIHLGAGMFQQGPDEVEEAMQGYEGEFQLLGLS